MIVRFSHLLPAGVVLLACLGIGIAPASAGTKAAQASASAKAKAPHARDKAGKGRPKAKTRAGVTPVAAQAVPKSAKPAAAKRAPAAIAQAPAEAKAVSSGAAMAPAVEAKQERAPAAPAPATAPAPVAGDVAAYPAYSAIPAMTAKEKAAYARLPVCKLSADGTRLAVEPCRTAPPRKEAPHRSVMPQMPRVPTVVQPANPQLVLPSAVLDSGRAPSTGASPASPGTAGVAQDKRPIPVANCTPGGCTDIQGNRYIGSGGILTTPGGKSCTNTGGWIQCN